MTTSAEFEHADIQPEPGEWLIREGEEPGFFVVLAGVSWRVTGTVAASGLMLSVSSGCEMRT
jgi:hypothetical protein